MSRNTLGDLSNHLFMELERLNEDMAAEAYAVWQEYDKATVLSDHWEIRALNEIADCITACCNLAAAIGCDDMRPFLQMAEFRNEQRGRYE